MNTPLQLARRPRLKDYIVPALIALAVIAAVIFLRGQVSQDLDTRESLHVGDATAQTAKTMANIKMLMEEAGGHMDHICRIVVYLTDIRYRQDVYREMGKWLKGVFPCSTGLVITALAVPSAPADGKLASASASLCAGA